jgi:hypothetical protein
LLLVLFLALFVAAFAFKYTKAEAFADDLGALTAQMQSSVKAASAVPAPKAEAATADGSSSDGTAMIDEVVKIRKLLTKLVGSV